MKRTLAIGLTLICCTFNAAADCAVLLHGLARSDGSMKKMEKALSEQGYTVHNIAYPSTQHTIETLAPEAIQPVIEACAGEAQTHFITHSMGGILVRYYFEHFPHQNLGRVVMLGPPNQGSEVVDKLGKAPGFHALNGDAGLQLKTDDNSIPNQLGPVTFDLGVIAGKRSVNLILSRLIPGKDDGKVSIESTKVEGMSDHIVMPVTHTFMMKNKKVIKQVLHYLEHGMFERKQTKQDHDSKH